jgi:hypothetical protein
VKAGDLVKYLSRVVLILGPGRKRGWFRGMEVGTNIIRQYNIIALKVIE